MTPAADPRLRVVICWHLHQPQYRVFPGEPPVRPWVYLHGLRDYVDLAVALESQPDATAVVAFSPVLLEQLDRYCVELAAHLRSGTPLGDPMLQLLTPPYAAPQVVIDRAVWFHLAWCGESVREGDPRVRELLERGREFEPRHLHTLLECIADALAGIVPRFRRLAGNGQVELAVSPWGHPILPLLQGFDTAREAEPGLVLPAGNQYPGGEGRARWHVARALQVFSRAFGLRPRGCWPAEGALSSAAVNLLAGFGFDWVASGESVLRRSLAAAPAGDAAAGEPQHFAYAVGEAGQACFFRDDELSDRISFTYGRWDAVAAADDLVARLERVAERDGPEAVVAIVLDGDNAFDLHPRNGQPLIRELYARLGAHPRLRLATFSQCLAEGIERQALPRLVAGSWIRGSLATWIGNAGRNHAWQALCEAKVVYDQVMVEGSLDDAAQSAAERQLGVCEGSDWFWSFADDAHDSATEPALDALYRRHLLALYAILGESPPPALAGAAAGASGQPAG